MADHQPNRSAAVLARLRRDLGLGVIIALLGALVVVALAVTIPSAAGSTGPGRNRSAVTPSDHHAVVAAAPTRPRSDAVTGLAFALATAAVLGGRWLQVYTGGGRPLRHDPRARWRARMVGAPPSFS